MEIPIDRKSAPAASSGLPHRTLRDLDTKHGDFMRLQLAQASTVTFLVVAMTTTYECTVIVFAPYGTYWRYLRKICTSELLSAARYAITARAAFGKTCKDQEVFISVVAEETKVNSGSFVSEFFPSLKFLDVVSGLKHRVEKIHGEADRIVGDIVNDHKESRAKGRSEDEDKEDLVDDGEFPLTD
ncbi:hypothetical protein Golax_009227, partial [Gossypium laxum]|nr:hypothetical protein [Gossypium laxum]